MSALITQRRIVEVICGNKKLILSVFYSLYATSGNLSVELKTILSGHNINLGIQNYIS